MTKTETLKLCHSYVMGMDDEILSLTEKGFDINRDGEKLHCRLSENSGFGMGTLCFEILKIRILERIFCRRSSGVFISPKRRHQAL